MKVTLLLVGLSLGWISALLVYINRPLPPPKIVKVDRYFQPAGLQLSCRAQDVREYLHACAGRARMEKVAPK